MNVSTLQLETSISHAHADWIRHFNETCRWKRVFSDDKKLEIGKKHVVELILVVLFTIRMTNQPREPANYI